jgi:hypothetical protein
LFADKTDFNEAYQSCDRLLLRLCQLLQGYFFHGPTSLTILQRAQFCSNLDYTVKSYHGFFKRQIYQQVNFGAYQITKEVFGGEFGFQF